MEIGEDARRRLGELGVAAAWLFGSRATGRPRPDSDADVAVLLDEGHAPLSLLARGRIASVVAAELGVADVDLTVLDEAALELRAAVVRDGRLLAGIDEPRRVRFEVETLSRWFDVRQSIHDQDHAYLTRVSREGLS